MRFEDWPQRLNKLVEEALHRPFKWGEHDCCLFAARAVEAITGVDHSADLRGRYRTAGGATRVLRLRGGVRGIAGATLGAEIPPLSAQRGDIVMVPSAHGEALAVCVGVHAAVPGIGRLSFIPMEQAITAWRVA